MSLSIKIKFLLLRLNNTNIKEFKEIKAITKSIEAGLTAIDIPVPIVKYRIPSQKNFLTEHFFKMSINPALRIEIPAATGISLELTCDIPTQVGKEETKPKKYKAYFLESKVK